MNRALWLVFVCAGCACNQQESKKTMSTTTVQVKFGGLALALPPEFVQVGDTTDESPSRIPGEASTREDFRSYKAPDGVWIFLFHWNGFPTHDRGPMATEQEWEAQIGGQPGKISLTRIFFGIEQRVLTAHFQAPNGDRYLIYMKTADPKQAPDRERFMGVLGTIHFQ